MNTYVTSKVTSITIENSPANLAILLNSIFPPVSSTRLLNLATMPGPSGPNAVTTNCCSPAVKPKSMLKRYSAIPGERGVFLNFRHFIDIFDDLSLLLRS